MSTDLNGHAAATPNELDTARFSELVTRLINNIEKVIVGKPEVVEGALIGLLAGGHVLLEDVPGVGKNHAGAQPGAQPWRFL